MMPRGVIHIGSFKLGYGDGHIPCVVTIRGVAVFLPKEEQYLLCFVYFGVFHILSIGLGANLRSRLLVIGIEWL